MIMDCLVWTQRVTALEWGKKFVHVVVFVPLCFSCVLFCTVLVPGQGVVCQISYQCCYCVWCVGSSSQVRIQGNTWMNHLPPVFFCLLVLKGDKLLQTYSTLLGQAAVHSGSASLKDCVQVFPDDLRVSLFPWSVPTLCSDNTVSLL